MQGALGSALVDRVTGYSFVYHLELVLLFAALAVISPLGRPLGRPVQRTSTPFGLADLPG